MALSTLRGSRNEGWRMVLEDPQGKGEAEGIPRGPSVSPELAC